MTQHHVACLGAVVGLSVERGILRARSPAFPSPSDLWIVTAGASAARAERLAETLISRGATGLISFGIAGGLDPVLRPGALMLASAVVAPDGAQLAADGAWRDRVSAAIGDMPWHDGTIAGTDGMLATVHEKSELRARTGAAAADMESHGVARAAARRSVPFLVVRAIADPADQALPQSAVAGLDGAGAVSPLATLASLLSEPRQIAALAGVAGNAFAALRALWRFTGLAGGALAPG